jgi:hypothetical protein
MLKDDVIAYKERWKAVAEIEEQELRTTSISMKWRQLNSIINLAKRMGIFTQDLSEELVYQRWAKLKEKAEKQSQ